MLNASRSPIPAVVQQHLGDAAVLRTTRSVLVRAPHVKLHHLRRLDDRLAAHLDGLAVAGPFGWQQCLTTLASPGPGEMFVAGVRAIEDKNAAGVDKLMAIGQAEPELQNGLISAFGWVDAAALRGITQPLLSATQPFQQRAGMGACAMHHVDPGPPLRASLEHADASLRLQGLRLAGELGKSELLPICMDALADPAPAIRFTAARSACLLGDRTTSITVLQALAAETGAWQRPALTTVLKLVAPERSQALLKTLSKDPAAARNLICGIGTAGDPLFVPWLIKQMSDLKLSRLAAESFSMITGLDLAYLDLERKKPQDLQLGPNDNPADDDVAMDEDDSLPWPDPQKIDAWWQAHGAGFSPGTRYFAGAVPSPAHCLSVLRSGFQRQRIAAAEYLCLLQPGTPLFNVRAPAWRQERQLAKMGTSPT